MHENMKMTRHKNKNTHELSLFLIVIESQMEKNWKTTSKPPLKSQKLSATKMQKLSENAETMLQTTRRNYML